MEGMTAGPPSMCGVTIQCSLSSFNIELMRMQYCPSFLGWPNMFHDIHIWFCMCNCVTLMNYGATTSLKLFPVMVRGSAFTLFQKISPSLYLCLWWVVYPIVVAIRHPKKHMSGGQNYLLPAMDMAKVGGPLSVVKVCVKIGYRQVGGPLSVVKVFAQIWHPKSTPYYFSLPIFFVGNSQDFLNGWYKPSPSLEALRHWGSHRKFIVSILHLLLLVIVDPVLTSLNNPKLLVATIISWQNSFTTSPKQPTLQCLR